MDAVASEDFLVRPRGLEPPLVSQLAPQASASTNSATAARGAERKLRSAGAQPVTNRPGDDKGIRAGFFTARGSAWKMR